MIVHIVALEIFPNARSAAALVRVERVNVGARLSRQETRRPVYSKSTLNHTHGRYVRVFLELKGNHLYVYNYLIVTEKGGRGKAYGGILLKLFYNFYFTGLIRVHIKWHPSKFTLIVLLEQFTEVIKASSKTGWFPKKNTG